MSNAVQHLFALILLLASMTAGNGDEINALVEFEKPGIDKIAHLTAREHSTILFTIADYVVGYAKEGRVQWISSKDDRTSTCNWPHPALAHDGLHVAFVTGSDTPRHCRIVVHDTSTGARRPVVDLISDDPGEISWSWDDSEIAFFDHGIQVVSVRDGKKRRFLPPSMMKMNNLQFAYWVWYPLQWFHNGRDLVVELGTQIPTKEPGEYTAQSNLVLVKDGDVRMIDIGSHPAVSPISDRVAYYGRRGVVAVNADGTGRAVLTKAPLTVLFFKEDFFGNIVWSPDGNRLFFGTIVSEDRSDKLYLLDLKSGRREQFLAHTSITIRGWH